MARKADGSLQDRLAFGPHILKYYCLLFSFPVRSEHIDDLVLVELLHLVAGRTEVFARVELGRLLCKHLADGSRHGETGIGVNINLADSGLGSLAEFLLRNTDGSLEVSAVLVDHVHPEAPSSHRRAHRKRVAEEPDGPS